MGGSPSTLPSWPLDFGLDDNGLSFGASWRGYTEPSRAFPCEALATVAMKADNEGEEYCRQMRGKLVVGEVSRRSKD